MEVRRTMTMNWDGIGDLEDDDDIFFDTQRQSAFSPQDLMSSSSDEEYDDSRMSFSSSADLPDFQTNGYDMWMAAPDSITDRRRRLLQDMGLGSNKDLLGSTQMMSRIIDIPSPHKPAAIEKHDPAHQHHPGEPEEESGSLEMLVRSRSDGNIYALSTDTKLRREEMVGLESKQNITRTLSGFSTPFVGLSSRKGQEKRIFVAKDKNDNDDKSADSQKESILLIKNLENGNEFMVKECQNEGNWNELSDVQTGQQITMEEFEKNAGHSPKVKELAKKEDDGKPNSGDRKLTTGNSSFKKSFKKSKKKGAALFKNMKLGSMGSKSEKEKDKEKDKDKEKEKEKEKEREKEKAPAVANSPSLNSNNPPTTTDQKPSSQWVKARVHGKPFKEFTALYLNQEIKGHEGSISSMKFTYDGYYLATAGEDKVIHVWEVQECDVMAMKSGDDPAGSAGPDGRPPLPEPTPEKKKKWKKKKGIPDYVQVPETVFGLSETPFCTLDGHTDGVLDLCWSRSRLLLSSSMDKTVRLWDIETKSCLKLFSHSDYVTCIQFNPANDDYFISGSLDSKVRIWNIPGGNVVDWLDLHEIVTAVGFSNDGKVSVVGSQKGICRFYDTTDCKLEFKEQIELKTKKKPQPKKITGFQFSAWNTSEVLVTSADSRVRILDGTKLVQKYKGFKNINSQFSADFSPDGKYVISASEDSQVYIWRHEETKGKNKYPIITSYEHFPCKEVSVTAPWPGSTKLEQPTIAIHSKKRTKKSLMTSASTNDDVTHKPPIPKKGHTPSMESIDDVDNQAQGDSGIGPCESFSSAASGRSDDMTSPGPNVKSKDGYKTTQATAWGFVIVTAGLTGEIKVFQNVGLPFKVGHGRQWRTQEKN